MNTLKTTEWGDGATSSARAVLAPLGADQENADQENKEKKMATHGNAFALHSSEWLREEIRRAGELVARATSTVEEYLTTTAGRAEFIGNLDQMGAINMIGALAVGAAELNAKLLKVIVAESVELTV